MCVLFFLLASQTKSYYHCFGLLPVWLVHSFIWYLLGFRVNYIFLLPECNNQYFIFLNFEKKKKRFFNRKINIFHIVSARKCNKQTIKFTFAFIILILLSVMWNINFYCILGPPNPPNGKPCILADGAQTTVTWSSSPYDGGCKITGYTVEYSLAGSEIWHTACDDCHSLRYILHGLQPGARYVVRIRANNIHGSSNASQESDVLQMEEESNIHIKIHMNQTY